MGAVIEENEIHQIGNREIRHVKFVRPNAIHNFRRFYFVDSMGQTIHCYRSRHSKSEAKIVVPSPIERQVFLAPDEYRVVKDILDQPIHFVVPHPVSGLHYVSIGSDIIVVTWDEDSNRAFFSKLFYKNPNQDEWYSDGFFSHDGVMFYAIRSYHNDPKLTVTRESELVEFPTRTHKVTVPRRVLTLPGAHRYGITAVLPDRVLTPMDFYYGCNQVIHKAQFLRNVCKDSQDQKGNVEVSKIQDGIHIVDISIDKDNHLFIADDRNGIFVYDPSEKRKMFRYNLQLPHGISSIVNTTDDSVVVSGLNAKNEGALFEVTFMNTGSHPERSNYVPPKSPNIFHGYKDRNLYELPEPLEQFSVDTTNQSSESRDPIEFLLSYKNEHNYPKISINTENGGSMVQSSDLTGLSQYSLLADMPPTMTAKDDVDDLTDRFQYLDRYLEDVSTVPEGPSELPKHDKNCPKTDKTADLTSLSQYSLLEDMPPGLTAKDDPADRFQYDPLEGCSIVKEQPKPTKSNIP